MDTGNGLRALGGLVIAILVGLIAAKSHLIIKGSAAYYALILGGPLVVILLMFYVLGPSRNEKK